VRRETENTCKLTVLLQVIFEYVVTCFLRHSVQNSVWLQRSLLNKRHKAFRSPLLYRLLVQSVLRAAARLVLSLPGRVPVMSAIRDTLHWLSYHQRVTFKLCLTTYKCLHSLAHPYITRFCTPLSAVAGRTNLRSAINTSYLSPARLPRRSVYGRSPCRARCLGTLFPHSFMTQPSSIIIFRQSLKTYLFNNYSDRLCFILHLHVFCFLRFHHSTCFHDSFCLASMF